jgi:hypothetical protein
VSIDNVARITKGPTLSHGGCRRTNAVISGFDQPEHYSSRQQSGFERRLPAQVDSGAHMGKFLIEIVGIRESAHRGC